jgi:hypothetical protein
MCANIARKQFGHEQGRSGKTNPSRPGHGGGHRCASIGGRGKLIMKCKRASQWRMLAIGAVAAVARAPPPATGRRAKGALRYCVYVRRESFF